MSKRDGQIKALEAVLIAREKKVRELEGGAEHLASRYQVCVWARQCTGVGSRSRGPSRGRSLISCFVLPVCVYVDVSYWSPMVRVCWSTVHACVHACVCVRERMRGRGGAQVHVHVCAYMSAAAHAAQGMQGGRYPSPMKGVARGPGMTGTPSSFVTPSHSVASSPAQSTRSSSTVRGGGGQQVRMEHTAAW